MTITQKELAAITAAVDEDARNAGEGGAFMDVDACAALFPKYIALARAVTPLACGFILDEEEYDECITDIYTALAALARAD